MVFLDMKVLIKKDYLSKDKKTGEKAYFRDYFYPIKFIGYFLGGIFVLWAGIFIYILIEKQGLIISSKIIPSHLVFFVLAILFSLNAEKSNSKVTKP